MKQKWTIFVMLSLWLAVSVISDGFTSGIWAVEVLIYLIVVGILHFGDQMAKQNASETKKPELYSIEVKKKISIMEYFTMSEYNRELDLVPGLYFLERKPNPGGGTEDFLFLVGTSQGMPESFWKNNKDVVLEALR